MTALYGAPGNADDNALQEVVVTATRRAASAQDVPLSITAVSGATLAQSGIQDITRLAHSMAGVDFTDKGPFGGVNGSTLVIRGLNSETTDGQLALPSPIVPPVATYVDDTPLFANLRLQDLDHVEILRGPQGTLYGSGSLGGTIRFVQNAPDPSAFDARAEVGVSKTAHTHTVNDDFSAMVNLPLSDTFAVRLNGSYTDDAGFINSPNLYVLDANHVPVPAEPGNVLSPPIKYGQKGVNSYQYRTARVAALWKPNEDFKAQLSYYYQVANAGGFPYVATTSAAYNEPISQPPGILPQLYDGPVPPGVDRLSSAANGMETAKDKVDVVALTLDYDVGFATLTLSSSYAHHDNQSVDDLTALYTNLNIYKPYYGTNPRTFVQGHDGLDDKNWSEEIRLASKTGGMFDWVGGIFFKDQKSDIREHEYFPGYNDYYNSCIAAGYPPGDGTAPYSPCGFGEYGPLTGTTEINGIPLNLDQSYIGDFETSFKDLAVFGELTWHVTDAWSVTGGSRLFKQNLSQSQQTGLLFVGPAYVANNAASDVWRRALWKVNTSFKFDATNLVYATWSQGFRRGGVNALPASEPFIDPTTGNPYVTPAALTRLQPDTADNYEIGVKGTLQNRIRYSAAIYDIQWHNMQEGVQLTPLQLSSSFNIGEAYSRGVELELSANLTDHLSAQLDYTYDRTKLTSLNALYVYPNVAIPPPDIGISLPGTPKNSVALALEYGGVHFAGGELRYSANAHYQSVVIPSLSATAMPVPGYTMVDTRLSFTRSHWRGTVYVNNVTNTLGINAYSDSSVFGNRVQAIVSQPRTVGFSMEYSFKEW